MRSQHLAAALFSTLLLFVDSSTALLVAPGSECRVKCGNVLESTDKADIVCGDYIYDSGPGATMKSCLECELDSGYKKDGGISDMQALLYNIRYTADHCIFNDSTIADTPCMTQFACGHFKDALQWGELKVPTEGTGYEYCDGWDDSTLFKCQNCLGQIGGQHTMFNYMTTLSLACKQRPAVSKTLEIEGNLFDGAPVKAADPAAQASAIASTFHPPTGLSAAAIVGIACGGAVAVLIIAGCLIVWRGRRRRRAYLANYSSEKQEHGYTGGDMSQLPRWKQKQLQIQRDIRAAQGSGSSNESPHSASSHSGINKPSNWQWPSPIVGRGEEHSPVSAVEPPMKTWSPYLSPDSGRAPQNPTFSPYISQVASPISPMDAPPKNGQWAAVPIPKAYRRGSVGTLTGRVEEGETIEMHNIDIHQSAVDRNAEILPSRDREVSRDRDVEKSRPMDGITDFGRSPVARSTTGSVRSGRSGRSFRERVVEDDQWRSHPSMAGFVPAPAPARNEARSPPVSMMNASGSGARYGHQRSVSVESIGEAL